MKRSMSIYIAAVLIANYTATWFIPLPLFGLVSVGTLVFGVTFTQRDRVHRHGRKAVYTMILAAAVGMVLESLFLGVPWRIISASFIAIVLSESADTEVYQKLLARPWLQRVTGSNLVSIPLDSLLFNLIAFAGVFAPGMLTAIIFGEIVAKFATGALVALYKAPAAGQLQPAAAPLAE
ncbi:MAG: VUT family protein [Desulfobacterales bacterium]|nr:VUT family protein [Desulfobacterales bacterium]